MSLLEYQQKRNFNKTPEPKPARSRKSLNRFVIQKHDATRLHYDFRLELAGALKSWAVPKGIPLQRGEKHLAIQVEDHPLDYIHFEGTIPKGQYGGGTVMVWDYGTYEPLSKSPVKDLENGKLHFVLRGQKIHGEWYLTRFRNHHQWLLIRGGENMKPISKKRDDTSALSGKTMKELSVSSHVWQSKPTRPARISTHRRNTKSPSAAMPKFLQPMKAKLVSTLPSTDDWIYEIKFDGWRALALKSGSQINLLSRNEKDFSTKFPEIMTSLALLEAEDFMIDGEIVALDSKGRSSFQLLQAYDLGEDRPPIFFYAFDLLQYNGENLLPKPVLERKAKLEQLLKSPPGVIRYSASLGNDPAPLLDQARKIELEGLIGKRIDSRYEAGRRSGSWIKLKLHKEQELVIGGYTDPKKSRKFLGALIIGFYQQHKLICAGKVGSGFSQKSLQTIFDKLQTLKQSSCPFANLPHKRRERWAPGITASEMKHCHWVKPTIVCQLKFNEWTHDNRLRQPVFLGLREDKDAEEVVREEA